MDNEGLNYSYIYAKIVVRDYIRVQGSADKYILKAKADRVLHNNAIVPCEQGRGERR